MTELLISLLSSGEKRIVKNALFTIETLSYHFDNVVALCEVGEEMLKGEIIEVRERERVMSFYNATRQLDLTRALSTPAPKIKRH